MRVDMFVIDGENDFCASGNEPDNFPTPFGGKRQGSLFVTGADLEAQAVAAFIKTCKEQINKLHVTLDSHHKNDCSHHTAWKGRDGKSPPPFTIVSHQDVVDQKWIPRFAGGMWQGKRLSALDWALKYTKALEDNKRSVLCLWPEHCLIQTWGCCIYWPLQEAYNEWCASKGGWINYVTKGQYPWTEHYSAMRADVEDPTVPMTQLNADLINDAAQADKIIWTGWAGSHCLRWTALDAVNMFGSTGTNDFLKKSVFVEDACAPVPNPPGGVPNFVQWRQEFLDEVSGRGAEVTTLAKLQKQLLAL